MDPSYGAVTVQPGQIETEFLDGSHSDSGQVNDDELNGLNAILDTVQSLTIHQHLDAFEVCMGWERNNRYSIYDTGRKQILYVYEAAQCYARQCYGSLRELSFIVTDNEDNKLLRFHRPFRCSSRMCYACCNLQEMKILLPSKQEKGDIYEKWSCCSPQYEIHDESGNLRFLIQGDPCHFRCCCSIGFKVVNAQGDFVSSVTSTHAGCASIIGAYNEFTIKYDGVVFSFPQMHRPCRPLIKSGYSLHRFYWISTIFKSMVNASNRL